MSWKVQAGAFTARGTSGRNAYDSLDLFVKGNPATDNTQSLGAMLSYLWSQLAVGYIPGWSPGGNIFDHFEYSAHAPASGTWKVAAVYRNPNWTRPTGDGAFTGGTSGGRQHIIASVPDQTGKPIANAFPATIITNGQSQQQPTPANNGLIGAGTAGQAASGVDIDDSITKFKTTYFISSTQMQTIFNAVQALKGRVNSITVTFSIRGLTLTCPAGSLKWGGWEFAERVGFNDWELTHHWEYAPNETGIQVGYGNSYIAGIVKNGWDYLEVIASWGADPYTNAGIWIPQYAVVHRVYRYDDLNSIIPGTTSGTPWGSAPINNWPPPPLDGNPIFT